MNTQFRIILFVSVAFVVGNAIGAAGRQTFDTLINAANDHRPVTLPKGHDDDGDGYVNWIDCVDYDADINPGAQEICDGIDNDCDHLIDAEDDNVVLTDYCYDGNHDGRCDELTYDAVHVLSACTMPDDVTIWAIAAMTGGDASRINSYIKVPDEGDTASTF